MNWVATINIDSSVILSLNMLIRLFMAFTSKRNSSDDTRYRNKLKQRIISEFPDLLYFLKINRKVQK